MSVEKQRELDAWYKARAAEENAKAWLAIQTILARVDQTVYAKQYGKEIPEKLFIQYFNAKNKIADAKRDIEYYKRLRRQCRPAELDMINRKIEQNQKYIDAWTDRIVQGFKGWFETYGYPFMPELMPKLDFRKDRMTLGVQSRGGVKALLDLAKQSTKNKATEAPEAGENGSEPEIEEPSSEVG